MEQEITQTIKIFSKRFSNPYSTISKSVSVEYLDFRGSEAEALSRRQKDRIGNHGRNFFDN